jgi:bifunctional non-homologous end joining protein LigD
MLARAGDLPTRDGWLFEPKLDGFRCLVCTHGKFTARSRRGWDMTALLPELAAMPDGLQLDGEIIAPGHNGHPDFHNLSRRMLRGEPGIAISYIVFDVVACEGGTTTHLPYEERRQLLEALELNGTHWRTTATFDDGAALLQVMVDRSLEGVVAKRLRDRYLPGDRSWVKVKNRATARFNEELRGVRKRLDPPASREASRATS